jgi:hypothetical protein
MNLPFLVRAFEPVIVLSRNSLAVEQTGRLQSADWFMQGIQQDKWILYISSCQQKIACCMEQKWRGTKKRS